MTRAWLGRETLRLETVASTNDEAARRARDGAPHGLCVLAEAQTRGRGRQQRAWHSPPGENIYLSVVLRLPLAPRAAPPLTLAAGVALSDAVSGFGLAPSLKWPNDVLLGPRKTAGILTEMSTRGDRIEFVILGVGLNVNTAEFPPALAGIATSLRRERGGAPLDRDTVTEAVLVALEQWIDRFVGDGAPAVAAAWRARPNLLGTRVRVADGGRTLDGVARDIDDEGALWLEADDGARHRLLSGELT